MSGGPRWYVVAAKYRQERAAALAVQALGFPFFLPMVSVPLPHGASELRPLFGRYLFAEFDAGRDAWGAITRLPCVCDRAVLYGSDPSRPVAVPGRMLDAVRAEIVKRGQVRDPVATLVSIGASVRLVDSVAAGREGVVTDTRRGAREARVEFDGFTLPIWVPADRLTLLRDAEPGRG
jgi:transcription antitermination factor NusG